VTHRGPCQPRPVYDSVIPGSPPRRWLSHASADLVFDQPVLVVPDGAALLAQTGDHHPPRFHVLHVVGDGEVELQLPAPDAEIDPSLGKETTFFAPKSPAACTSGPTRRGGTSPAGGFGN